MNLTVKKGIMQDASFITSDPSRAKKDKPREIKLKIGEARKEPGRRRVRYADKDTSGPRQEDAVQL